MHPRGLLWLALYVTIIDRQIQGLSSRLGSPRDVNVDRSRSKPGSRHHLKQTGAGIRRAGHRSGASPMSGCGLFGVRSELLQPESHPALDGSGREAEVRGDLGVRQLAVVRERDHFGLGVGKHCQCRL